MPSNVWLLYWSAGLGKGMAIRANIRCVQFLTYDPKNGEARVETLGVSKALMRRYGNVHQHTGFAEFKAMALRV
jgi:hypothetical protein